MNIGQAASAAGVTPKMIRHYESLGLLPEPERTEAGYRLYGEPEVAMLRFIRQSRDLGFSMPQVQALLVLWRDEGRHSAAVKEVALAQLAELEERQRELTRMKATLAHLVSGCAGNHDSQCAILETLATRAAVAPAAPRRALKQVRPGQKMPRRAAHPARTPAASQDSPHAGLMAWSRGIAAH